MRGNFFNLTDRELDKHIYRIMPEQYVFDMFRQRSNVLTQVHKWKDKFENFLLKAGGIINGERFHYAFKNDFVGQCWTKESHSEAMWGIYANETKKRFLRIRSTPRKLLTSLVEAHLEMPQDTCFLGGVKYETEAGLQRYLENQGHLEISSRAFANSLLYKRKAFEHESEVRLLYFGNAQEYRGGLHFYPVDPHLLITQIMADPNRDRQVWIQDRERLKQKTRFVGEIKRSKIYDSPAWKPPIYKSSEMKLPSVDLNIGRGD